MVGTKDVARINTTAPKHWNLLLWLLELPLAFLLPLLERVIVMKWIHDGRWKMEDGRLDIRYSIVD